MFGLFRRPAPRPLTDAIHQAIQRDGRTPATFDPAQLRMVESSGRYSDCGGTYFRVFDPAATAQRMIEVKRYLDLDAYPELILQSGHVESDGKVVVTRVRVIRNASPSARSAADRSQHLDDAHIVVHGETGASANARPVEAPASGDTR